MQVRNEEDAAVVTAVVKSEPSIGIRTRIAFLAAIGTVMLFSAMGTAGFWSLVNSTRDAQQAQLQERVDSFEERLDRNEGLLISQLQLDASLVVVRDGEDLPVPADGTLQIVRLSDVESVRAIVGTASTRQSDQTLARIRIGLWISVALAGLFVGAISWLVVDRALAPVRRLTVQARSIEANPSVELLEVGPSGDELAELAATLNGLLNKLRLADSDRRRFVSDASHELRTPLMVISADAEYARDHGGETAELAGSVLGQTERLTTLVDDLLTLASLDEAQTATDQITTIAEMLTAADASQFVDALDPSEAAMPIPDISRAVGNVIANARRHQTSAVDLSVCVDGPSIRVVVDDDGPGIPVADREAVFKRFFRPDEGRSRGEGGAGLGLAIAQADVAKVGGTIVAEASPLGGARFTITLPKHSDG